MRTDVKIYLRQKIDGSWKFIPAPYKGRKLVPPPAGASFYLRYHDGRGKRIFRKPNPDYPGSEYQVDLTLAAAKRIEAGALDGTLPKPEPVAPVATRRTIRTAVKEYLEGLRAEIDCGQKGMSTFWAYSKTLEDFQTLCADRGATHVDEISEKLLLAYRTWCNCNVPRRQGTGHRINTLANRFRNLNAFLKVQGIKMTKERNAQVNDPGLLRFADVPRMRLDNPEKYTDEEIAAMRAVCTEDELDLIDFLLVVGFRDDELAHTEFTDVDWENRTINIGKKNHWTSARHPEGWDTKSHRQRQYDLPLPASLIARLAARKERMGTRTNELIFPKNGKPSDTILADIVRPVFIRAGLTGKCGLHKFRKNSATWVAREFGVETARLWMGHRDITTTMRYLCSENMSSPETRNKIDALFPVPVESSVTIMRKRA